VSLSGGRAYRPSDDGAEGPMNVGVNFAHLAFLFGGLLIFLWLAGHR
jgi:hypothetical protein